MTLKELEHAKSLEKRARLAEWIVDRFNGRHSVSAAEWGLMQMMQEVDPEIEKHFIDLHNKLSLEFSQL